MCTRLHHTLPPRPVPVDALRAAVAFTRAPVTRGCAPYATPLTFLNAQASRKEDFFSDVRRDGPRTLNEAPQTPYWRTLGAPWHHPVIERCQRQHPESLPWLVLGVWQQLAVDAAVGLCAIALAIAYGLVGHTHAASQVLRDHGVHLVILGHCAVQVGLFMLLPSSL